MPFETLPFPAYSGDDPFVFVSYAHADADKVYPELELLRELGFNIWYDEGVSPGQSWPDELADAIGRCHLFVTFLTRSSVGSTNVTNEIDFALAKNKPFDVPPRISVAGITSANMDPLCTAIAAVL